MDLLVWRGIRGGLVVVVVHDVVVAHHIFETSLILICDFVDGTNSKARFRCATRSGETDRSSSSTHYPSAFTAIKKSIRSIPCVVLCNESLVT